MHNDLIPLAVRIALRNAVGGSGPYSVRQIAELFDARDFTSRDPNTPDAGGERPTEAEARQSQIDFASSDQVRRYLDLEPVMNYGR